MQAHYSTFPAEPPTLHTMLLSPTCHKLITKLYQAARAERLTSFNKSLERWNTHMTPQITEGLGILLSIDWSPDLQRKAQNNSL